MLLTNLILGCCVVILLGVQRATERPLSLSAVKF